MIFVPVQLIMEELPIEGDVQHSINTAWRKIVEICAQSGSDPIHAIVHWLSQNAKGGHREWVDILRREPSSEGHQRIMGHAGYSFRNPVEAMKFKDQIEEMAWSQLLE